MQKVTCPQCRTVVEINPDAPLCRVCSADLRTLLTPEATTRYFYQRAGDLAAAGQLDKALSEVNRGLSYEDDSDLRLLGAILAKRVGDYTQMRSHVAAIPVDDVLRSEGEWLIRSLQESPGAIPGLGAPTRPSGVASKAKAPARKRSPWPVLIGLGALLAAALLVIWFGDLFGLRSMVSAPTDGDAASVAAAGVSADPATPSTETVVAAVVPPAAAAEPGSEATPVAAVEPNPTEAPTETPTPEPTPTETPLPTATPTPDVTFDVTDYLMARGFSGLALLDVVGELDEGTLVLTGTVTTVDQQRVLLDVLKENPNVVAIDTTNLRLDIPETYTVVAGDSLWIISNKIYGDSTYMDDIFLLNRDILPSPEVLIVGSELRLPPVREEE